MSWAGCWFDRVQICRIQITSYSEEVFVLSNTLALAPPANSSPSPSTAVFLHGFSFNSDRDRDLMAIVQDLEFVSVLESRQAPWRVIIPWSPGKNRTYRAELTDFASLLKLVGEVHRGLHLPLPSTFELWAHSGAYKTVMDVLANADQRVQGLRLLDATYRAFDDSKLSNWLKTANPNVEIAWLKGSPTHLKAEELRMKHAGNAQWTFKSVEKSTADHWSLVPFVLRGSL